MKVTLTLLRLPHYESNLEQIERKLPEELVKA